MVGSDLLEPTDDELDSLAGVSASTRRHELRPPAAGAENHARPRSAGRTFLVDAPFSNSLLQERHLLSLQWWWARPKCRSTRARQDSRVSTAVHAVSSSRVRRSSINAAGSGSPVAARRWLRADSHSVRLVHQYGRSSKRLWSPRIGGAQQPARRRVGGSRPDLPRRHRFRSESAVAFFANQFKIPTLWGIKDTSPYFHDNGAKTLRDAVAHYQRFFNFTETQDPVGSASLGGKIVLTDNDVDDIVAYLKLLSPIRIETFGVRTSAASPSIARVGLRGKARRRSRRAARRPWTSENVAGMDQSVRASSRRLPRY